MAEVQNEPRVRAEIVPDRPISIIIELPHQLTRRAADDARQLAHQKIEELWGAPFSLLIDARGIDEAADDALQVIAEIEEDAGRSRFLVRIARVVDSEELAELANQEARAAGWAELTQTFTAIETAREFLDASAGAGAS